jgi:hypothetical protein
MKYIVLKENILNPNDGLMIKIGELIELKSMVYLAGETINVYYNDELIGDAKQKHIEDRYIKTGIIISQAEWRQNQIDSIIG